MPSTDSEHPRRGDLVIGSNGGIGGASAARLAKAGHRVIGVDRDMGIDVTKPGGAEEAVALATRDARHLDGVVHAIGMSGRRYGDGPVTACTDEAWSKVMCVNAEAAFRVLRAALPAVRDGGSVVLVGSVLRSRTDEDFLTAAYAASKGALLSLTRIAAREVARRGVRVNLVAPGLVDTPMAARALQEDGSVRRRLPDLQPLGGTPVSADEVAGSVCWLLSEDSTATTGSEVLVDRGWSLR